MAVAFVQRAHTTPGSQSVTLNPTMPAGIVAGHLILIVATTWDGGGTTGRVTNIPAGYSRIYDYGTGTGYGASSGYRTFVFTKPAVGSDSSPTLTTTGSVTWWDVEVSEWSGLDPTLVLIQSQAPATGTSVAGPAITTVSANNLIVHLLFDGAASTSNTTAVPSGSTQRYLEGWVTGLNQGQDGCADQLAAAAGTVTPNGWTRSNGSLAALALTLAMPPPKPASGKAGGAGTAATFQLTALKKPPKGQGPKGGPTQNATEQRRHGLPDERRRH